MKIRFYIDPATDLPHIYEHDVDEDEVWDILTSPEEIRRNQDNSKIAIGQTQAGRYLRVIFKVDTINHALFVITAYELDGKPLQAYRRRKEKKKGRGK
jgi:hypothetical protein